MAFYRRYVFQVSNLPAATAKAKTLPGFVEARAVDNNLVIIGDDTTDRSLPGTPDGWFLVSAERLLDTVPYFPDVQKRLPEQTIKEAGSKPKL